MKKWQKENPGTQYGNAPANKKIPFFLKKLISN
jgi:hypothetical protein